MSRYKDKKKTNHNVKRAYDYLVNKKGIKPHLAAGIIGNLQQESYKTLDSTVENGIGAVGIAQWLGPRRTDLENFARSRGKNYKDFDLQLDFLHHELTNTGNSWGSKGQQEFFNAPNAEVAAAIFVKRFERSGEKPGEKGHDNRVKNAKLIYSQFNDKDTYAKDEKGQIVVLNPEVVTEEDKIKSPAIKREFYLSAYDIPQEKKVDVEAPPAVKKAKQDIEQTKREVAFKNQLGDALKQLEQRGEPTTQKSQPRQTAQNQQFQVQQNEFYQQIMPQMEPGGKVETDPEPPRRSMSLNNIQRPQEISEEELKGVMSFVRELNGETTDPEEGVNIPGGDIINEDLYQALKGKFGKEDVVNERELSQTVISSTSVNKPSQRDKIIPNIKTDKFSDNFLKEVREEDFQNKLRQQLAEGNLEGIDLTKLNKSQVEVVQEVLVEKGFMDVRLKSPKTEAETLALQTQLLNEGYYLGDYGENEDGVDGKFGSKTRAALSKYNKGLTKIDGEVGDVTKGAFNKYTKFLEEVKTGNYSLETEEALIRKQKPKVGAVGEALNFIGGNISEFLVNPIKNKVKNTLPKSIQYNPELDTTYSEYDNTEGVKKYLLDSKSIEEIRKEKNISFNQISKNKAGNKVIPLQLKKRIVNSIYPQGYTPDAEGFLNRFNSEESFGDKQIKRLEGERGNHREDIFLMYSGLPQRNDSFTISSFKAGAESDTNVTFKDPNKILSYLKTAAVRTDLFDKLANGEITPESIANQGSNLKGAEKIHKASFRDPQNVMWNATFGIGYDKAGMPYLSFYDNWDLKGKDDNAMTKGVFGSPIEIYDRIPLTEELIKKLAKVKKIKQDDAASDKIGVEDSGNIDKQFSELYKDPEVKKYMGETLKALKARVPK